MENVDMFNNATAQLTFHDFLDRMRHPSAADLVRSIKNFIGAFLSNPPEPERDSQSVQDFLSNTEDAFKAHSLWAGATEAEFESSGEGLEKYLMTKLFTRAFAPLPEDAEQDQRLSEKMSILQQFIRPEHLDILEHYQNETSWLLAQKELQKINTYKAPRDKLVCILNCCRVINNLLLNVSMATKENPPGADDFLPVLIFVVIKANPPQLHSNLLYIQRYRHQKRLVSEASYFYTNLVSAESFIANLNSQSLSMDPTEFEQKMEAGQKSIDTMNGVAPVVVGNEKVLLKESKGQPKEGSRGESPADGHQASSAKGGKHMESRGPIAEESVNQDSIANAVSVGKLEEGAVGQVLEADRSGQLAKDYPFLYASAGDLRVMDVQSLLHEYKELVLRYVALRTAVEGSGSTLKPAVSLGADTGQELGVDPQGAESKFESLAQILTRPEERAELLTAEGADLHSEPGLDSEPDESTGFGSSGSPGEDGVEKSIVENTNSSPDENKEVPQDTDSPLEDSTEEPTETEDPAESESRLADSSSSDTNPSVL